MTDPEGDLCPNYTWSNVQHGSAKEPHPCPYREDVHQDTQTTCKCCEACTRNCAEDI